MAENHCSLAGLVGPCPECGNGQLESVFDGERVNFLCRTCWLPELDYVRRVNPETCPGCPARSICRSALRPYGQPLSAPR